MAKIIYQPWIAESFRDPDSDEHSNNERRLAMLIAEAQRRVMQQPGGLEGLLKTEDPADRMPPEHWELLDRINAGKEPSRIAEVRPDKDERKRLKALGLGKSDQERRELRLAFEIEALMQEAERLAPVVGDESERRDPAYPKMRRRSLESLLDNMTEKLEGDDGLGDFLRTMIFKPPYLQAIEVKGPDGGPVIYDPQRNDLHRMDTEATLDQLRFLTSACDGSFLDLQQNGNLRILVLTYMAAPSGEPPTACSTCFPKGLAPMRLEFLGEHAPNATPVEK